MRDRKKNGSRFWLISAIVHAAIFAFFFLTPAGQRILEPEERKARPDIIRKDEDLAKVVDQLRALAVARLREQVAAIDDTSHRMEAGLVSTLPRYEAVASAQSAAAPERLERTVESLRKSQDTLLNALRSVPEEPSAASLREIFEDNRAAITTGQEEIRRALLLTSPDDAALNDLQQEIEATQFEILELTANAIRSRSDELEARRKLADGLAEQAALSAAIDPTTKELRELEKLADPLKARRTEASKESVRARDRVGGLKKRMERATAAGKEDESTRKELEEAEARFAAARETSQALEEESKQLGSRLNALRKADEEQKKRLPILTKDIPSWEKSIPKHEVDFKSAQAKAVELQEKVIAQQETLVTKLLAAMSAASNHGGSAQ